MFTDADATRGDHPVIVNDALARLFLAGKDPLGRRVTNFGPEPYTVVGVVGDVRQSGLAEPPRAEIYFAYGDTAAAGWLQDVTFVIKTSTPPQTLADPARAAVQSVAPDLPVFGVRMMDEILSISLSGHRLNLLLLGIFAGVALVLSMVGLYGVISYLVTQRTREMGIRMALGAQARDVVRLVMRQGAALTAPGVSLGLVGAFAFTRLLKNLLYGVSARDPITFGIVATLLAAVALLAAYVPARRASRADPLLAIRTE